MLELTAKKICDFSGARSPMASKDEMLSHEWRA